MGGDFGQIKTEYCYKVTNSFFTCLSECVGSGLHIVNEQYFFRNYSNTIGRISTLPLLSFSPSTSLTSIVWGLHIPQ